jgi:4-hydroxybenzoate polyprenyltransferase
MKKSSLNEVVLRPASHRLNLLKKVAENSWLFTESDSVTFILPNSIFGICCAIAGQPLIYIDTPSITAVLLRIPSVILFNWTNLLVFDLANQRLWESVEEDKLNKPWRPIPCGNMTRSEVRQAMQLIIPLVLAINHYLLNVGAETACIMTGTWVYNDLKASDDGWVQRNMIIALAFGVFNWSSLKVAIGGGGSSTAQVTSSGFIWILMISGVILTTMHVQDLKDTPGDKRRGRQTAPLVLGEMPARYTLAVPILLWTPVCVLFWRMNYIMSIPVVGLGTYVAWRCIWHGGNKEDRWTWQLWCAWTALLSLIPVVC